jgi:L-fucose mutarotase/ribose pyranase (RbsD/FucU family)
MSKLITSAMPEWERGFNALLPVFGHRNWIVVADSAYPAQAKAGIETIVAGEDQIRVVRKVLDAITASSHVRANVLVDRELDFVPEIDAPGVTEYREHLKTLLYGFEVVHLAHEQIIHKLDQCAQVFRILVIKTDMTIPYTSVFFELECDYWNAAAEERLRQAIAVSELR